MTKRLLIWLLCFIPFISGKAQPYGNEWINYGQSYYKIYVKERGIYRIPYSTLASAGIPAVDARRFQLFFRGEEQYIFTKGTYDGTPGSAGYIEFYGQANDGVPDAGIYDKPASQPNNSYSLFCDSAAYFLTWNTLLVNRRLTAEADTAFSAYAPVTWFYSISRQDYLTQYFPGKITGLLNGSIEDPSYNHGEGWFDTPFSLGGSKTKTVNTPNRYIWGPDAEVRIVMAGASETAMHPNHHMRIQFAGQTIDTTYEGYILCRFRRELQVAQLANSNTFTFTSINDLSTPADRNTISYISIKYPHNTDLENLPAFRFWLQDALQPKSYLNLSGLNFAAGDTLRLYDVTNHKRIKTVTIGAGVRALVANSGGEKECYISSDAQVKTISGLIPVGPDAKFVNYMSLANSNNANYYILTHQSLMAEAENYRAYRENPGAGLKQYKVLMVDVDNLWDQYRYGILKDPMAIRNFMHSAYHTFSIRPEFLFIIGKGYRSGSDGQIPNYRRTPGIWEKTLVPAFGTPPSDLLFTTGILDTLYQPAVPTGRLAARNTDHIRWYLDKIIDFELQQLVPQEWMKYVLHFGGGADAQEQQVYRIYLEMMENIIEDTLFGGWVRSFWKTSPDPIQINQSDSLKNIINNGVSIMNFFGHAAGIGFDQGLDHPSEYNNTGKYPLLIANSCFAGDIFLDVPVSSEDFVLIENKGVIAYLASVASGLPSYLNQYSNELYQNIGWKNYGEAIGVCTQKTIKNIQTTHPAMKENCLEMTLHGDPAIVINSFPLPDYKITSADIYFDPPDITAEYDSFYVNVIPHNIGRAINDSMIVRLQRTLPESAGNVEYLKKVKATLFNDTISFKLPVDRVNGMGMNIFTIKLDHFDMIEEMSEMNNEAQTSLLLKSAGVIPVIPYKYAVVPSLPVTLRASVIDAFAGNHRYVFELDTTDAFNSSLRQQHTLTSPGGVISWTPSFPVVTDSIVYYWRVSPDSLETGQYQWRESSFQYINTKKGWSQAHFYQFKNDDYQYVRYNKPSGKFEFVNQVLSLDCQTGVYPHIPWNEEWYKLNQVNRYIWAYMGNSDHGMIVAVFDTVSGEPWDGPVDNTQDAFEFSTVTAGSQNELAAFIDSVPDGNYILAYSHRNHYAENWTEPLYQAFESFGSGIVRSLVNQTPYIIFGRKGNPPGMSQEVTGTSVSSIITLEDSIRTKWKSGYIQSELIGPASEWGSLHWRQRPAEPGGADSVHLNVIGVDFFGNTQMLISELPPDSGDIFNLASRIDAAAWPYLKLMVTMSDEMMHTPAQMKYWTVLYEGVPETALNPSQYFSFFNDTVQEGQTIRFATATENISAYPMDSLLIKYWIIDKDRNIHPLGSFRRRPHPAGDILIDSISKSTMGLAGLNRLWIEVNPDNDQPEQYHFNNMAEIYFYVTRDKTNPILDVTFDGVHILDGDIVSARPEIQVMLKDENRFMMFNDITDTAHFKVWLANPGASEAQRIWFRRGGEEILQFIPASGSENRPRIIYHPLLTEDGIYKLRVQAEDKSKNTSGDVDYEISFEVINKSTITSVMNWPNPFTTATHFVFTLTGSEVPDFFMIQIMSISGRVVREIGLDELGPIHVGRNITEYAWDGTDNYGDRLANGVYLYRVITRISGNSIEKSPTQADQYFRKDFGKMVLMR